MAKRRKRNPKGVMPPALKKYWASRRKKTRLRNPKRRRNPIPTQHVLLAQRSGGPVLKYTGAKFASKGHAARFQTKDAALSVARSLRAQFAALKPYRMWAT